MPSGGFAEAYTSAGLSSHADHFHRSSSSSSSSSGTSSIDMGGPDGVFSNPLLEFPSPANCLRWLAYTTNFNRDGRKSKCVCVCECVIWRERERVYMRERE